MLVGTFDGWRSAVSPEARCDLGLEQSVIEFIGKRVEKLAQDLLPTQRVQGYFAIRQDQTLLIQGMLGRMSLQSIELQVEQTMGSAQPARGKRGLLAKDVGTIADQAGVIGSELLFQGAAAGRNAICSDFLITESVGSSRLAKPSEEARPRRVCHLQIGISAAEMMHHVTSQVIGLVGLTQKVISRMKRAFCNLPM